MQQTIGNTLGAGFLGTLGAAILFGVTIVQAYGYYVHYPNDWVFQKIFVAVLLVLNTVHLAVIIQGMYEYMIVDFGNPAGFEVIVWSFKLQTVLNFIVVVLVQSLYALRIWKLGQRFSRFWPFLVVILVIGGYAVGILLAVETYKAKTFSDLQMISWAIEASFSTSTGIDIILSAAMCFCLYKSRTPFRRTNSRIVTIANYVIVSGALTSTCSLACVLAFVTMRNNMVFLGISFLLTKVYISSYMAMLNARRPTREQESPWYGVSQGTKLKNIRRTDANSTIPGYTQPKTDSDSFQLESIDYHAKADEEFSPEESVQETVDASKSGFFGITVHTTEERHYG